MFSLKNLSVLGLVAASQAHIIMTNPKIFNFEDSSTGQAPLADDGADFPCKMTQGTYGIPAGGRTSMPLGSGQYLAFVGTAVHGGGSCQISITYDTKPTKNSVWKVIHSIEGGCPMRNIVGNNGNSATTPVPDTFDFTIPTGLPTGEATLAWTWFNRVGNREMYMNCAPITITGGTSRDTGFYNSLPKMFTANIDKKGCETDDNLSLKFFNPGSSVERNAPMGATGQYGSVHGNTCDKSTGGSPAPGPAPSTSAGGPAPTTTKKAAQPTLPGGVFITVDPTRTVIPTQPTTTLVTSQKPVVVAPSKPAVSAPPAQATTLTVIPTKATTTVKAPVATGGPSGAQSGPCTQEGRWNCISGSSFQQCASGSWSTPQPLAAGTQCTAGQSDAIDIKAISARDPAPAPAPAPVNKPSQPASKPKTKKIVKKKVIRINKKHLHQHQARS